jgi:hypothetical protein
VLTPELRQLALDRLRAADYADDGESLVVWFSEEETPDNHVLDASYSEAESLMVTVIADAINDLHTGVAFEDVPDPDETIRILTRH